MEGDDECWLKYEVDGRCYEVVVYVCVIIGRIISRGEI